MNLCIEGAENNDDEIEKQDYHTVVFISDSSKDCEGLDGVTGVIWVIWVTWVTGMTGMTG